MPGYNSPVVPAREYLRCSIIYHDQLQNISLFCHTVYSYSAINHKHFHLESSKFEQNIHLLADSNFKSFPD